MAKKLLAKLTGTIALGVVIFLTSSPVRAYDGRKSRAEWGVGIESVSIPGGYSWHLIDASHSDDTQSRMGVQFTVRGDFETIRMGGFCALSTLSDADFVRAGGFADLPLVNKIVTLSPGIFGGYEIIAAKTVSTSAYVKSPVLGARFQAEFYWFSSDSSWFSYAEYLNYLASDLKALAPAIRYGAGIRFAL